jgi:hypothetical protein
MMLPRKPALFHLTPRASSWVTAKAGARSNLKDQGLLRLAEIVHAADIAEDIDQDPIARGLSAIASGFSLRYPNDKENLAHQFEVYDALYAWCQLETARSDAT